MSILGVLFLPIIFLPIGWCADGDKKPYKEFDYLLETGRLYTKQISHQGISLVIGSRWIKPVPRSNETTVLQCTRYGMSGYIDSFLPKIEMIINETHSMELSPQRVNDYFVYTVKEVWSCNNLKSDTDPEFVATTRIVTEIVGSVEINQILYHDGVEVISKRYYNGTKTAIIKEVKYYDSQYNQVLKYEGKLEQLDESTSPANELMVIKSRVMDADKEVSFDNQELIKESLKMDDDSTIPPTLRLGKEIQDQDASRDSSTAECEKYQGANGHFPSVFRIPIAIQKTQDVWEDLTENNYLDYITPIREEIWICTYDKTMKFWRIFNEFISRPSIELNSVEYYDANVIDLHALKMPPSNTVSIRAKLVAYHDYIDLNKRIKYAGKIKLLSPETRKITSLKSSKDQIGVEMKEMEYVLQPGRAFRSCISSAGLHIRIGAKHTKTIGTVDDTVKCKLEPSEIPYSFDYGTKFRLIARYHSRTYLKAITRSKQTIFWKFIKQEVWICEKIGVGTHYKFLRIVNELKGKKELNEVDYYDGIQLYSRLLEGIRKSVNVLEIKYIDQADLSQVYKYEGKLILESPSDSSNNFIDCLNCDGQPIRETEDAIVMEVGELDQFSTRSGQKMNYQLKVGNMFAKALLGTQRVINLYVGKGTSELKTVGNENDVIECEKLDTWPEQINDIFMMKQATDKSLKFKITVDERSKYGFELIEQKVWICYKTNNEYRIYRVFDKFKLAIEVYKIFYGDEANLLSFSKDGFELEETKYLTADAFEMARFDGSAILLPNPTDNIMRSGTVDVTFADFLANEEIKQHSNGPDITYDLEKERIYKMTILESGETVLEIGKKWTTVFGNSSTMVKCDKNNGTSLKKFTKKYITPCITIPDINPKNREDKSELFGTYFLLKSWEVWDCKSGGIIEFKRVVTHFELRVADRKHKVTPVKEIRYYDGLTVSKGKRLFGGDGWLFKEVRYIDNEDPKKTLKYVGKLELNRDHIDAQFVNEFENSDIGSCLLSIATHSMSYQLNDGKVFITRFESGIVLKVGTRHQKVINDDRVFSCEKLSSTDTKHEMQVLIGKKDGVLFKYVPIGDKNYIKRTSLAWECQSAVSESASIKLIRVMNILDVTTQIAQIIHYDGVTVSPDGSRIQEIKFIDNSDNKTVKFDGFFILDKFSEHVHINKPHRKYREIDYVLDTELMYVKKFQEDGQIFELSSKWKVEVGNSQHTAECDLSKSEGIFVSYLPKIGTIKTENQLDVKDFLGHAPGNGKVDQRRSAYNCKSKQSGEFMKIVNENKILSPNTISEVYYPDGVTVWFDHSGPDRFLYVREVKFMWSKLNNNGKLEITLIKFEGSIINRYSYDYDRYTAEGTSIEESRPPTPVQYEKQKMNELWFKRKEEWITNGIGGEPLQNIIFTPRGKDSTRIHSTVGLNIDVGSQWEKVVGSFDDVFSCQLDDKDYDANQLMTRIVIHLDYHQIILDENSFSEYFQLEERHISKCSKGPESFLRVMSKMTGKKGIKVVNYYNGVSVFKKTIDFATVTAGIIEQKYLDPTDFKVIKYIGKLEKNPSHNN